MSDQNAILSERELEILRLVATGAANKEIARQLVISPNTVKVHLRNIFTKIGVTSRTEATLYAIQIGLVPVTTNVEAITGDDSEDGDNALDPTHIRSNGGSLQPHAPAAPGPLTIGAMLRSLTIQQKALLGLLSLLMITISVLLLQSLVVAPLTTPRVSETLATPTSDVKRWFTKATLPVARKGMGAVEYDNAFYVASGETQEGIDGILLRYDGKADEWQALQSKPTPVTDIQAALLGEKIYIPGGRLEDGSDTNALEAYDPRQDTWESLAPLPLALSGYALAAFEGRLYLFGGMSGDTVSAAVFEYAPQENEWFERTAMPAPRAFCGAAVIANKIFVMGGTDGQHALTNNAAYYPSRDAAGEDPWETLAPLPEGRYAMGVTHLANVIYLAGGVTDQGTLARITVQYIPQTDEWAEYDAPPIPAGAHGVLLASGGFLHYLGGESAQGLLATHEAYQAIYTYSIPILRDDQ